MALNVNEWQECPRCKKYAQVDIKLLKTGPHHAEILCSQCGRNLGYVPKPKNKDKLEKRPNGCPTPKKLGINYCQICLRPIEDTHRQYLETHHIDDEPKNNELPNLLVVCLACHKLINWTRTYLNE